ncbi:MAG: hypothetical protein Q4D65_02825 [Peptostreptococcaceae bacterium]|nr:hypothetical protein [Peptostreptococcaceae bacterium]
MDKELEKVLEEVLEHTKDCNYNRAQNFIMYNKYKRKYEFFEICQNVCLICIIVFYALSYGNSNFDEDVFIFQNYVKYLWHTDSISIYLPLQLIPALLSVIAIALELWSSFRGYANLSQRCWLAAHSYSRLYRECQFVHNHFADMEISLVRQKACSIASELNDLNLLSPHIEEGVYKKVDIDLKDARYPIENVIHEVKLGFSDEIINDISKNYFKGCDIEVILFGSFINNSHYNDIDLAIVIHEPSISFFDKHKKVIEIQKKYLCRKINLDITILTLEDINNIAYRPFVKGIQKGILLYKSPKIYTSSVMGMIFNEEDYSEVAKELSKGLIDNQNTNQGQENDEYKFISQAYYYFYYTMAHILTRNKIEWVSERTLLEKFIEISLDSGEDIYKKIQDNFSLVKKLKDSEISNINSSQEFRKKAFQGIIQELQEVIKEVNQAYFNNEEEN